MKTKKLLLIIAILLLWYNGFAQGMFTISGNVKRAEDGEELISADIYAEEITTGTITNNYGLYYLTLPKGNYTLKFSYTDCISKSIPINLNENTELNVELLLSSAEREETFKLAKSVDKNIRKIQKRVVKLSLKETKHAPGIYDEQDIQKTFQPLPGGATGHGGSSFRDYREEVQKNLIILYKAPVYNATRVK